MGIEKNRNPFVSIKAYAGDCKTLLAFDLLKRNGAANFAGFTVQCEPKSRPPYYLFNTLRFENPGDHAQDPKEPANSSINAPIHKFRWLHVPGSVHQGLKPFYGDYTYTATPRYFDGKGVLQPLDSSLSVSVTINVGPFAKGKISLGFTRGFTQSQAFDHHFGKDALLRPKNKDLLYDTKLVSGSNAIGDKFTFEDEYEWLGLTAREKIFDILNEVSDDASLSIDVFAYDLNEPDFIGLLMKLAKREKIRIILDNASLHHATPLKPEDQFEKLFRKENGGKSAPIKRGHFKRYAHDKVFVVYKAKEPFKVLTGSTNFSITGMYVNSNHVLVIEDNEIAKTYAGVFKQAWESDVQQADFVGSEWADKRFSYAASDKIPQLEITFSPHKPPYAQSVLDDVAARIEKEGSTKNGSVFFAVMELDNGTSPVYTALSGLHKKEDIFTYGISDNPGGIALYPLSSKTGVMVTGKPVNTQLPPPFDQVKNIGGVGHQVHHKFVVCGFNGEDPTVYSGSSNLALGGEKENGDNLITIRDGDIATVFAIEALGLVDHFNFLDGLAQGPKSKSRGKSKTKGKKSKAVAAKEQAAASSGWFLDTNDKWVTKYFDQNDLHCMDRLLFA
jgi:hypothetical protein